MTRGWERILSGRTELGFPHRVGRYRPGGSLLLSPIRWSCRYMEAFLIRGWERILPGCRSWGFHTVGGDIVPGDHCFHPRLVGVVHMWNAL